MQGVHDKPFYKLELTDDDVCEALDPRPRPHPPHPRTHRTAAWFFFLPFLPGGGGVGRGEDCWSKNAIACSKYPQVHAAAAAAAVGGGGGGGSGGSDGSSSRWQCLKAPLGWGQLPPGCAYLLRSNFRVIIAHNGFDRFPQGSFLRTPHKRGGGGGGGGSLSLFS